MVPASFILGSLSLWERVGVRGFSDSCSPYFPREASPRVEKC